MNPEKFSQVTTSITDFIQNNPGIGNKVIDAWRENQQLSKQLRAIESNNYKQIYHIAAKYDFYKEVIIGVLSERAIALQQHYKVLDDAILNDDKEIILASLNNISSIVSQNPLENFTNFTEILENNDETLVLDF